MNTILDFIGLIGGAGALIVGISAYTSKLWADWFMQKKTAEYDKQIELYKSSLELEIEKYKALNEQIVYKNMKIFDTEYKVFQEITPQLIEAKWATVKAMGNNPDEDYMEELHKHAIEKCHEFRNTLLRYVSFMDKAIYDKYETFYYLCMNSMTRTRDRQFETEDHFMETVNLITQMDNELINILNDTREYLRSMATIS